MIVDTDSTDGPAALFATQLAHTYMRMARATEAAAFYLNWRESAEPSLETVAHLRNDECDAPTRTRALSQLERFAVECLKLNRGGYCEVRPGMWCVVIALYNGRDRIIRGAVSLIVLADDREEVAQKMEVLTGNRWE